jgi:hypothetical protein
MELTPEGILAQTHMYCWRCCAPLLVSTSVKGEWGEATKQDSGLLMLSPIDIVVLPVVAQLLSQHW